MNRTQRSYYQASLYLADAMTILAWFTLAVVIVQTWSNQ